MIPSLDNPAQPAALREEAYAFRRDVSTANDELTLLLQAVQVFECIRQDRAF